MALPLLLIGTGIGLPWGLMDGLAVSTVAPDRVGMATGIFNTVRISADGVALAVAGAVLSVLVEGQLVGLSPDAGLRREMAGQLAQADLARAAQALPGQDGLLAQVYGAAFHDLLLLLAGLAVVTALAVLWLLERKGRAVSSPEQLAPQAGRRLS